MIFAGINIEPIVTEALARAGYGSYLVPEILNRMTLHLLTMEPVTPERIAALVDEMLPDVIDTFANEAIEYWPSVAIH